MLATLTSKGQITLPKEIRDALALEAGTKLDFSIQSDGTLSVRPMKRSVSSIVGLLRVPSAKSAAVEELDRALQEHLAAKHDRILHESTAPRGKRRKVLP